MGIQNDNIRTKTAGALYPLSNISDDNLEPYKSYLDDALGDDNIKNIALSAPYGGGKTSILMSYFKNNFETDKYQFITLPNFFEDSMDLSEEELQEKIIEQLLYKASPRDLPYSKINRINDKQYWREALELIFIVISLIILSIILNNIKVLRFDFNLLVFILMAIPILWGITYFYRYLKVKLSTSTLDIKSNLINISLMDDDEDDLKTFSKFSEEILYYFREMKTEYIIFEDLDRFKNPKIFQDLRELNTNINKQFIENNRVEKFKKNTEKDIKRSRFKNSRIIQYFIKKIPQKKPKKKVVFIYSLRDSIFVTDPKKNKGDSKKSERPLFSPNDKAKFFDYIIPVFPKTDYYNSSRLFIEEFKHHDEDYYTNYVEKSINFKNLISDIGYFINDYRIIKLISHEFFVYKKNIEKNNNSKNIDYYKLFAVVIYKNFNPADFEKINSNSSELNYIFNNLNFMLDSIVNEESKKIEDNIKDLSRERDNISEFLEFDINELLKMEFSKILEANNTHYLKINNENYTDYKSFYNQLTEMDLYEKIHNASNRLVGKVEDFFITVENNRDLTPIINAYTDKLYFPSKRIEEIDDKIYKLSHNKNSLHYKFKDYNTGKIISEFLNIGEEIDMGEEVDKADELKIEVWKRIENLNPISRMLLVNNYINDDFIRYISPVKYATDESDAEFIAKVLNRIKFKNDQLLINSQFVLRALNDRETHHIYMYSSDIISLDINPTLRINIIESVIDNDDFEFMYNFFSKKNVDEEISSTVFEYLISVQKEFFRKFIIEYSDNTSFLINAFDENYINNSLMSSKELEKSLSRVFSSINDSTVLYKLFTFLNRTENLNITSFSAGLRLESTVDNFIKTNSKVISNKIELLNFIFKYDLFKGEIEDYIYFKEVYGIDSIFKGFVDKIAELNISEFNIEAFIKYVLFQYNKSQETYETYSSFSLFIDYVMNTEKTKEKLLTKISKLISDKDLLESYKNVKFEKYSPVQIDGILDKIKIIEKIEEELISNELLRNLIENQKINYSTEFINVINQNYSTVNQIIYPYLEHAFIYEEEKFMKTYTDIKDFIHINVKILLFSKVEQNNGKELILNSIDSQFDDISDDFITTDIFKKMLELNITREQLIELMHNSNNEVRSLGLEYLLDNPDIKISSRQLDYVLGTSFFESTSKNGREIKKYRDGVVREYIKSLEKYNYAEEKKDGEKFSIFAKFSERFPQP